MGRSLRHVTSKSLCVSSATRRSGKVLQAGSWKKNSVARWRSFALLALISRSETANILIFESVTFC